MPLKYQTNPIIAWTFVSFKGKKTSFDSLIESKMTIFPNKFLINEWSLRVKNFTRQFWASIFEECIKFNCNLVSINNRSIFLEKIFSVHFFQITFISCVILCYNFGFNFTSFLRKYSSQSNQFTLKKGGICIFDCVRYFDVTLLHILQFDFKQLYGILGNNTFKKILQFFLGIEFHRKVS